MFHFTCPLHCGMKWDFWSWGILTPGFWIPLPQPSCQINGFYCQKKTCCFCTEHKSYPLINDIDWGHWGWSFPFCTPPKNNCQWLHCKILTCCITTGEELLSTVLRTMHLSQTLHKRSKSDMCLCLSHLPDPTEVHCHLCPSLLLCRAGGADLLISGHLGGRWGWYHRGKLQHRLQVRCSASVMWK